MARPIFYPTRDQLVTDPYGSPVAGQTVRLYTAPTGGSQITDLLAVNPVTGATGSAIASGLLVSDGNGFLPAFASVDGGRDVVYADCGPYGARTALVADPSSAGGGTVSSVDGLTGVVVLSTFYGPSIGSDAWLKLHAGGNLDALIVGTITRDGNGAATGATVAWPDGTAGVYAGTASSSFPGAIDSFTVTWVGGTTKTVTQPAVTRNSAGAVTARPAMTVA